MSTSAMAPPANAATSDLRPLTSPQSSAR
jgi:hypothetical protein